MARVRRIVVAIVFGVCLLAGTQMTAPGASAGAQWCDTDPVVVIVTPRGAPVPVFVTSGALGVEHLPAVLLASTKYTVAPVSGGTLVKMDVVVPNDIFAHSYPTRTVASTGPLGTGMIYARASGTSGKPMRLTFTLSVR